MHSPGKLSVSCRGDPLRSRAPPAPDATLRTACKFSPSRAPTRQDKWVTSDNAANKLDKSDNAGNRVDSTRALRWALALALVLAALAVFAYWLTAGTHLACQVVTVTARLPGTPATTTTTQTCGLPDVTDFVYVLAAVVAAAASRRPAAEDRRLRVRAPGLQGRRADARDQPAPPDRQHHGQHRLGPDQPGAKRLPRDQGHPRPGPRLPAGHRRRSTTSSTPWTSWKGGRRRESWTDLFAGILTMHALIEAAQTALRRRAAAHQRGGGHRGKRGQAEEAESVISDYLRRRYRDG